MDFEDAFHPEHDALLGDSVSLALLVVLDRLSPAERLAFVLHDLFAVSFEEIARILERSPAAAKKLASRARRRVQGADEALDTDRTRHWHVVEAFLAAARGGDLNALMAVLDPDVVRRADRVAVRAGAAAEVRGAHAVATETVTLQRAQFAAAALIDGVVGIIVAARGQLLLAAIMTNDAYQTYVRACGRHAHDEDQRDGRDHGSVSE